MIAAWADVREVAWALVAHRASLRADFRRYYGIDLVRTVAASPPGETMDLVRALLEHDSHTARAINDGPVWVLADYLAADQVEALTGKRHPGRPTRSSLSRQRHDPERIAARERALARKREREQAIREGRIK